MGSEYLSKKNIVVGVLSHPETLLSIEGLIPFPVEMAEVRLDKIGGTIEAWADKLDCLESSGTPIILTIRAGFEGGEWLGADEDRLTIFENGLSHVSFVDIEYRSKILNEVASAAANMGRSVIVSYHDFEKTPDIKDLEEIITKISKIDQSVAKIATMVNSPEDIQTLESLLSRDWGIPLSVIGMGDSATDTRISFPLLGSALTYGYIDESAAPGQLSAEELKREIAKRL